MKNLLVGNGINIQFNKTDYTNQQIVLRILKNCDRDDFPTHIIVNYPYLLKNHFGNLYLQIRLIIENKYDKYASNSAERESLISFKKRYSKNLKTLRITDVGFEDYYLIHDLVCNKCKIKNPDRFYSREAMRISYLYAIYNDGRLNELYEKYSYDFIQYLNNFDNIFSTNYDSNIESVTGKEVFHIHGQFDKKSDVYDSKSLRNQLPDAPIQNIEIDEEYFYLYSNALTSYCGKYKELQINQQSQANLCVENMAKEYNNNPSMRREIDMWALNSNNITYNLSHAIKLKAKNPNLSFNEDYHFKELKNMTGSLEILGLSPWNDFHIFESIDNANIDSCIYYYYNEDECETIKDLLPMQYEKENIVFKSVKEFWEKLL